jgi:hypothetical protein
VGGIVANVRRVTTGYAPKLPPSIVTLSIVPPVIATLFAA